MAGDERHRVALSTHRSWRAADTVTSDQYDKWFDEVHPRSREEMCRSWGQPPGEMANVEGRLIVPGVRNGNVFIGLQPLRGLREQAEALTHSTDVVIPHQYLSYYRWIRDVFEPIIISMGLLERWNGYLARAPLSALLSDCLSMRLTYIIITRRGHQPSASCAGTTIRPWPADSYDDLMG